MQQVCSDTSISEQPAPPTLSIQNKQLQDTNEKLTKTISEQKQEIESLLAKFNSGYTLMDSCQNSTESLIKRTPSLSDTDVQKLKEENSRMREVYESHMRVCTQNTTRLVRKSSSVISHSENEELKKKILMLECSQAEIERHLHEKAAECKQLHEEITKLKTSDMSEYAVNKLEDLVDVILQQKSSSSNCLINATSSSVISGIDTDSLKSIVTSSLSALQEELRLDHESTRERIKNSTHKILNEVQCFKHHLQEDGCRPRKRVVLGHHQAPPPPLPPTVQPVAAMMNSIDEVELIRDRLDHLQQTIYGRESDFRKLHKDRDRVQGELVKLMELMKRKDEELG